MGDTTNNVENNQSTDNNPQGNEPTAEENNQSKAEENNQPKTGSSDEKTDNASEVEEWKKHSRTWENRAKKSEKEANDAKAVIEELKARDVVPSEELNSIKAELETQRTENRLWRELTTLGVDAHRVMDSRSFMSKVAELSSDDEDFLDSVKEALGSVPSHSGFNLETPSDRLNSGDALYERIHGKKNN